MFFRKKQRPINEQDIAIKYLARLTEPEKELFNEAVDAYSDYLQAVSHLNSAIYENSIIEYQATEEIKK